MFIFLRFCKIYLILHVFKKHIYKLNVFCTSPYPTFFNFDVSTSPYPSSCFLGYNTIPRNILENIPLIFIYRTILTLSRLFLFHFGNIKLIGNSNRNEYSRFKLILLSFNCRHIDILLHVNM